MAGAVIDDVYDVLEGALAELLRTHGSVARGDEERITENRFREARAAAFALSALMREGHAWRPAEDGHDATTWRDKLLLIAGDLAASPSFVAMLRLELDELVALATPGPRRPLPAGLFERLARRAGVGRDACATLARDAGDDLVRGWRECDEARWLVRIALAIGTPPAELMTCLHEALLPIAVRTHIGDLAVMLKTAIERPDALVAAKDETHKLVLEPASDFHQVVGYALDVVAQQQVTPLHVEWAFDRATRRVGLEGLREAISTSALRDRLAAEGGN